MGKVTTFIMGGLVGACAALALAPRTGEEARAAVASKVAGVKDSVVGQPPQQVYQDVTAAAASFIQDAAAKGQEAYAQAAGRVQESVAGNGGSDELRSKIEAARARITEQMMANIDESREAVDAVEAEVEEVEAEAAEPEVEPEAAEATEE